MLALKLMVIGLLCYLVPVQAAEVFQRYPKTSGDFAILPEFCTARYESTTRAAPAIVKKWKDLIGSNFIHVHHYCAGLHLINFAAKATSKKVRDTTLNAALGEIGYTRKHAYKNFILQPEMSYKSGKVLLMLGKDVEAITAFNKSIEQLPKYTPSYAALGDYYKKVGFYDKAKQILIAGLKISPRSKRLKKRLKRLASFVKSQPSTAKAVKATPKQP